MSQRPHELSVIEQAGQNHRGAAEEESQAGIDQGREQEVEGPRDRPIRAGEESQGGAERREPEQ